MKKVQHQAIEEGFLDLLGTEATEFQELDWKDLEQTLVNLAAVTLGFLLIPRIRKMLVPADTCKTTSKQPM